MTPPSTSATSASAGNVLTPETVPPALKRFKFLAAWMSSSAASSKSVPTVQPATASKSVTKMIRSQLAQYITEIHTWQLSQSQTQSSSSLTVTGDPGSTAQTCGGTVTGGIMFVALTNCFWEQNSNICNSKLAHLAQDLICTPASQAYDERVFSLCGILTAGRRSSMRKSPEVSVFLKLNQDISQQTGFPFDSPDLTVDCSFICTVNDSVSRTV